MGRALRTCMRRYGIPSVRLEHDSSLKLDFSWVCTRRVNHAMRSRQSAPLDQKASRLAKSIETITTTALSSTPLIVQTANLSCHALRWYLKLSRSHPCSKPSHVPKAACQPRPNHPNMLATIITLPSPFVKTRLCAMPKADFYFWSSSMEPSSSSVSNSQSSMIAHMPSS